MRRRKRHEAVPGRRPPAGPAKRPPDDRQAPADCFVAALLALMPAEGASAVAALLAAARPSDRAAVLAGMLLGPGSGPETAPR